MRVLCGGSARAVEVREAGDSLEASVDGRAFAFAVRRVAEGTFVLEAGERRETFHCVREGDVVHLFWKGAAYRFEEETEAVRAAHRHLAGGLEAPMPGRVIKLSVAPGDEVKRGDELLVVEAMKMENAIRAPRDGRVKSVAAVLGQMVSPGVVLVEIE